jgi:MGT family glycosyltransferase
MKSQRIAVFCMESIGHFNRLRPLVRGLAERGAAVDVFTHRRFEEGVRRDGGRLVDLFATHSRDDADAESIPFPCRSVSFAGLYAEEIRDEVRRRRPALVIYDTFAVIGYVVAKMLGLPYVAVCAGHNINPSNYLDALATVPQGPISPRCTEAVRRLRDRHGLEDAGPFLFATTASPLLNLYCEPAEFLSDAQKRAFEPVAFFGSLPAEEREPETREGAVSSLGAAPGRLRVYVSFGTVVWKYFPAQALAAARSIAEGLGTAGGVRALVSFGGHASAGHAEQVARANVAVADWVDQWAILKKADLLVTHHGLNSTHEAVLHRVPMLSHPFFWDQPGLAEKCRELGLAIPLSRSVGDHVKADDIRDAVAAFRANEAPMRARLEQAREWEARVIAGRVAVIDRVLALL